MRISILILVVFAVTTASAVAKGKKIYADIQVTDVEPTNEFVWERANQNTTKYPIELARSGIRGCAVLSFNILDSGKTENIEVINSLPNKYLGKYSRKMIKKWKWVPTSVETISEKRTLRLDFCMGRESIEQAQNACKEQTKLACR